METTEIKSRAKRTVNVLGCVAVLGLLYVGGKRVGEYLLTDPSEQLAKEIILAYKKTIPTGVDTLIEYNNSKNDTFFIDVMSNAILIQYKSTELYLSENGNVVSYKSDHSNQMYTTDAFQVFSVDQFSTKNVFESILHQLQKQQVIKNNDYNKLEELLKNEEIESL